MSAPIPVRVAGALVIQVPPIRLSWAAEHPELIALMGRVKAELIMGEQPDPVKQLALGGEFVREVARLAGYPGDVDRLVVGTDVRDVVAIHAALRGVEPPDPTDGDPASASG